MERCIEAELLDELPPENLQARQSRRDLQRLNAFMGHTRVMARCLRDALPYSPSRIVEFGCGDGTFLCKVAKRLASRWRGVQVLLLDRQCLVKAETLEAFRMLGWSAEVVTTDLFDWLKDADAGCFDAVVANLFLHHFSGQQLADAFRETARRTNLFAALEPRRARMPLLLSRMVWLIGCNEVTRHDAPASVRAGFNHSDLSTLWPAKDQWILDEHATALFSHLFVARRVPGLVPVCAP
jgi:SAM-dependent methyltransferase